MQGKQSDCAKNLCHCQLLAMGSKRKIWKSLNMHGDKKKWSVLVFSFFRPEVLIISKTALSFEIVRM